MFKEDARALDQIIPIIIETLEASNYSDKMLNLTLLILEDYFKSRKPFNTSTIDYISPALNLLKKIKNFKKVKITFSKTERDNDIYLIDDLKIPFTSYSQASKNNFRKTKIDSIYISSILNQIYLTYSL